MIHCIDLTSWIVVTWFIGMCLHKTWNAFLTWREKAYVTSHERTALDEITSVHSCAKDFFTQESLRKSLEYERTVASYSEFNSRTVSMISFGILLFGVMPYLFSFFNIEMGFNVIMSVMSAEAVLMLFFAVVNVPFSHYFNFNLEEKFGFNMMTEKTFWTDVIKSDVSNVIMSSAMTLMLFGVIECIHMTYGRVDVIAALAVACMMSLWSLVFEEVQIRFLMPLFNKFTPLEDGELKTRAEMLLRSFGFNPSGVFIVDASKRTKHSNAYCTGWGKSKKLVLYDTLLKSFSDDEILAILGHELAHSKLNHLVISRVVEFIRYFTFMAIATMSVYNTELYNAFGWSMVDDDNVMKFAVVGITLTQKVLSSWTWMFTGLESYMSRAMEFAADKFSCIYTKMTGPMITALFKLYGENLTFPLSDPLYESWTFSHPGIVSRVRAIVRTACKEQQRS